MEQGLRIFPFYLCVDISSSMSDCLPALNAELPSLKRAVQHDPIVGELARFALVTFGDNANQVLPLCDLSRVDPMPVLTAGGSTSYAHAFHLLHELLPHELGWYRQKGYEPYRPVVFFITDGRPNDGDPWKDWLRELQAPAFPYRPHIVAFGFGSVDDATLAKVATFKAYAAARGENPATVLSTITAALTESIVASSTQATAGQSNLVIPNEISGMYEISLDRV